MKLTFDKLDCQQLLLWQPTQSFQAYSWVKLTELPSPYSFDEALLLCQLSQDEWLAWIPDYGEILLNNRQFQKC